MEKTQLANTVDGRIPPTPSNNSSTNSSIKRTALSTKPATKRQETAPNGEIPWRSQRQQRIKNNRTLPTPRERKLNKSSTVRTSKKPLTAPRLTSRAVPSQSKGKEKDTQPSSHGELEGPSGPNPTAVAPVVAEIIVTKTSITEVTPTTIEPIVRQGRRQPAPQRLDAAGRKTGTRNSKTNNPKQWTLETHLSPAAASKLFGARINWLPSLGVTLKCHPVADTARSVCKLKVMSIVADPRTNPVLVDLFGNKNAYTIINKNKHSLHQLSFCTTQERITSTDQHIRSSDTIEHLNPERKRPVSAMMCDVYQVTPAETVQKMLSVGAEKCFVIRQKFNGAAGINFEGESPWYYNEIGELIQTAGNMSQKEMHLSCVDDLWRLNGFSALNPITNRTQCYEIFHISSVSDYEILRISPRPDSAYNLTVTKRIVPEVPLIVEVTYHDFFGREVRGKIFTYAFALKTQYNLKKGTVWNKTQVGMFLERHFAKMKGREKLAGLLGEQEFQTIVEHSIKYTIGDREHARRRADALVDEFFEKIETFIYAVVDVCNWVFGLEINAASLLDSMGVVRVKLMDYAMSAWDWCCSNVLPSSAKELEPWQEAITKGFDRYESVDDITTQQLQAEIISDPVVLPPTYLTPGTRSVKNTSAVPDEELEKFLAEVHLLEKLGKIHKRGFHYYAALRSPLLPAGDIGRMFNKFYPAEEFPTCKFVGDFAKTYKCGFEQQDPDCAVGDAWKKLSCFIHKIAPPTLLYFEETDDKTWIESAQGASKKQLYRKVLQDFNDGSGPSYRAKLMLKSDEVGMLANDADCGLRHEEPAIVKGRAIANIDPTWAYIFKFMKNFYKAKAAHFRDIWFELKTSDDVEWQVKLIFTCASTAAELVDARVEIEWAPPNSVIILDSSDDYVFFFHSAELGKFAIGGDLKSCDATQGVHAIRFYRDFTALRGCTGGMMDWLIYFLLEVKVQMKSQASNRKADEKPNPVTIRLENRFMTYSGETLTTDRNSTNTGLVLLESVMNTISKHDQNQLTMEFFHNNIIERTKTYGLVPVNEMFENILYVDFLKGWWVPNIRGSFNFLPLPSRILKMGKTRTNPAFLTKSRDPQRGIKYALYCTAQGCKGIPRNYPIIGPYLEYCDKHGMINHNDPINIGKFEKRMYSEIEEMPPVDTEAAETMFNYRYGSMDMDQWKSFLSTAKPGFYVTGMNMVEQLYTVDYGPL